jgi:hypothetical protein
VLVIGEERAADNADDRATVVSVAAGSDNVRAARPAVPVVDRSDTPPLDSASSLPAVRAGRRMRARVEALLDEARAVPLDAVDFPLLSLAERFRALADRRAAVLLFLADLDDSFVQTIERMYINVPSSRNVAVACVRGSQCRQPAQMVVLDNTAQDGGVTGELIANREQVGKQLQQLQQCARNLGAALLTLDAAIERVLDTEDVAAARALFFGMLESVVLADVVPPDSPALTAVIGSLQRLGTLLQAASQPRSDALLAEALGSLAIASSSSSSSSSSLSTRSRPILDAGEHEKAAAAGAAARERTHRGGRRAAERGA